LVCPSPAWSGRRATNREAVCAGIGERNLRIFRLGKLSPARSHALDFLFQLGNFMFEAGDLNFGRGGLAVSGFKLGQIPLDARLDLFQPLGHLGFRKVPVPRIDRFELTSADGNRCGSEQTSAPAHHDELTAHFADGRAIIFAEIGDGLEIRCQAACQPHRLDIALAFPLKPAARLNAVEIAVDIKNSLYKTMCDFQNVSQSNALILLALLIPPSPPVFGYNVLMQRDKSATHKRLPHIKPHIPRGFRRSALGKTSKASAPRAGYRLIRRADNGLRR
jgi:hypothetical protein